MNLISPKSKGFSKPFDTKSKSFPPSHIFRISKIATFKSFSIGHLVDFCGHLSGSLLRKQDFLNVTLRVWGYY